MKQLMQRLFECAQSVFSCSRNKTQSKPAAQVLKFSSIATASRYCHTKRMTISSPNSYHNSCESRVCPGRKSFGNYGQALSPSSVWSAGTIFREAS